MGRGRQGRVHVHTAPTDGREFSGVGGLRSGPVLMNRLLSLFELDFVLPGSVRTVATLLGTHLSRHFRRDIHNLTLLRKLDVAGTATPLARTGADVPPHCVLTRRRGLVACPRAAGTASKYVPVTTADLQRMYADVENASARIKLTVSFVADGWGVGSVSVLVARLTRADKEVEYTTRDATSEVGRRVSRPCHRVRACVCTRLTRAGCVILSQCCAVQG